MNILFILFQELSFSFPFLQMLACSVNAACLALLDAGVAMKGIVAASSVAFVDEKIIPFPSTKQQKVVFFVPCFFQYRSIVFIYNCVPVVSSNIAEQFNSLSECYQLKILTKAILDYISNMP